MPAGIPTPSLPESPAGTAPAMPGPMGARQDGRVARGKIVAGMMLELGRIAIPMLGNTEEGLLVTEVVAKLAKRFMKPPKDLQQSEFQFIQSQLGGQGGADQGAPPPQQAPQIPQPGPMPMAA
jgi:hypothetical protein